MSENSTDQHLDLNDDFILPNIDNKSEKIDLDKNLFKGPFKEFYNCLMEEGKLSNNNIDEWEKQYLENEAIIEKDEQIDEVKMALFFVLYHDCKYNGKYNLFLNKARLIIPKRLVIQDYKIIENNIKFGKKRYLFIPSKSLNKYFSFQDNEKEIIVKKTKKDIKMKIGGKFLQSSDDFISKHEKIINNIKDIKFKKFNNKTKSTENFKTQINEIKSMNDSDNKSMTLTSLDNNSVNKAISDNAYSSSNSKKKDDSENELIGNTFYDDKSRYIFNDDYHKEIDGIFTEHEPITLIKGKKVCLLEGLEDLLLNKYDIKNGLQSHIIFKNFDEDQIKKDQSFILEVKKSMAELLDLLNQIKDISKISNNIKGITGDDIFPKIIVGIICGFKEHQIKTQQELLNSKYKNEGSLMDHIMKIIESNNVKVVIGVIKDEKICGYNLGIPDYHKDIMRETRIDIFYMNGFLKNLEEEKIKEIFARCSSQYNSLTYTITSGFNYEQKYNDVLKELEKSRSENEKLQEQLNNILNYVKAQYQINIDPNEIKNIINKKSD